MTYMTIYKMIPIDRIRTAVEDAIYNAVPESGVPDGPEAKAFAEKAYEAILREAVGVPLDQVASTDIETFCVDFFKEAHPDEKVAYVRMEIEEGVKYFSQALKEERRDCDGKRWGARDHRDSKVLFRVIEDPTGGLWFRWAIYANAGYHNEKAEKVQGWVTEVVEKLVKKGHPVIMEK